MDSKLLFAIAAISLAITGSLMPHKLGENSQGFENFKAKYGKLYAPEEESYRLAVYNQNMKITNDLNAKGDGSFEMGENEFSDLTREEFKSMYLGF